MIWKRLLCIYFLIHRNWNMLYKYSKLTSTVHSTWIPNVFHCLHLTAIYVNMIIWPNQCYKAVICQSCAICSLMWGPSEILKQKKKNLICAALHNCFDKIMAAWKRVILQLIRYDDSNDLNHDSWEWSPLHHNFHFHWKNKSYQDHVAFFGACNRQTFLTSGKQDV